MGISWEWAVRLAVLAGALLVARGASAQATICDRSRSHVTVAFEGSFSMTVQEGVLSDLSAALAPRELSACVPDPGASARVVSVVVLTRLAPDRVRIEVDDRLTNKRVSRDVLLRDASDGASSLVLAVAADELLRATWAELTLRETTAARDTVPESVEKPPPEPSKADTLSRDAAPKHVPLEAARLPQLRIGLHGNADFFPTKSAFFGGDVFVGSNVENVVEWTFSAGPRFSRSTSSSGLGGVHADAVAVGLRVGVPLLRKRSLVLGPSASVTGIIGWFEGRPSADESVVSSRAQGWALLFSGGLTARIPVASFFLHLHSEWGATPRGYEVTDGRDVIGGMSGFVWSSGIGFGGAFEWRR